MSGDFTDSSSAELVESVAPDAETSSGDAEVGLQASGRPRRSRFVRVLWVFGAVALSLLGYYAVSLFQVWSTGRGDESRPVDAIVVMGAAQYDGTPSPQLARRLDQVVRLWPDGLAPIVVVTGGKLSNDRFTEAEASAQYLVERGVPESAIVLENQGSTSFESLDAVAVMLEQRGLDSVLIVTDPYHALRSKLIARELGLQAYVSPTTSSVVTGSTAFRRHLFEAGGVAVGRVVGFERLSGLTG